MGLTWILTSLKGGCFWQVITGFSKNYKSFHLQLLILRFRCKIYFFFAFCNYQLAFSNRLLIFDQLIRYMSKLLPLLICFFSAIICTAQIINIDEPKTYLPIELTKTILGISIADFQLLSDTAKMERNAAKAFAFVQFKLNNPSPNIVNVTYKFDSPSNRINLNRPLYEIGVEFIDDANADKFVTEKFTGMYRITEIADKEWFLSTNKDYWVIVRKIGKTVVIAAMISGTEWGFE